jgi:CBS-domain-containing membrane protein
VHRGKHIVTGTVHRVAIYDSHFRLMHIISQTDIIK